MHRRAGKTHRLTIQLDVNELPKPKQTEEDAESVKGKEGSREEDQIKEEVDT